MSRRARHIACLLGALLVLAAGGGHICAEDEKGGAAPSAEAAKLQKLVDEIRPEVAKLRGLAWKHDVPVRVLTREELRAFMQEGLARDVKPEEWTRDTRLLRRVGLLGENEDLRELTQLMLQEMVAGAYDPKTKALVLTEGFEGEGNIPTLVHELTHALEDQHFDLMAIEEPFREDDPDRQFAIRCLFEGSAEWARRRFETLRPEIARAHAEQMEGNTAVEQGQQRVMRTVPTHMLLSTMLQYRVGPNFVTEAVGQDYPGGMKRLMVDPPVSQEQILHPYKWLGPERDYPRTVVWGGDLLGALGAGWHKLAEHSIGEVDLAVYLDYFLGDKGGRLNLRTLGIGKFVDAMSSRAARGWDAGRAYYAEDAHGHIVVVDALAFDTPEDADEAARFLGAALRAANGDSWKGDGWAVADADGEHKSFDYRGKHGRGRILQRGREVLVLDGVAAEGFEVAWAQVARTSFVQDERDRGDEARDPFEGFDVVDRQRGLGLKLPGEDWKAVEGGPVSASFASARKGGVHVSFLVMDQGSTPGDLPQFGRIFLGESFDPKAVTKTRLVGQEGIQHPLPAEGIVRTMHLAGDAARTYVAFVEGPPEDVRAADRDIRRLLEGMPAPSAADAADKEHAGLRSIPGY